MRSFLTFKIVLFSFLLVIASCGHSSSDESSDDNNNDKEEHLDCSTETKMTSREISAPDEEDYENGSDSDIDDGSLDFNNLDHGTYSATVSYYNPENVNPDYCVYDEANECYLYKPAWVDFLVEKMQDENEYNSLYLL